MKIVRMRMVMILILMNTMADMDLTVLWLIQDQTSWGGIWSFSIVVINDVFVTLIVSDKTMRTIIWKWSISLAQMAVQLPKKAPGSQNPKTLPSPLYARLSWSSRHPIDLDQTHRWSPSWRSHWAHCDDSSCSWPTFCSNSLLCLCRLLSLEKTQRRVEPFQLWRVSHVFERERREDWRRKIILLGKEYSPLYELLTEIKKMH